MSAKSVAFFNNKGGVGKTSLVYHLAWMFQDLEFRVVAVDLDPQANLTAAFLEEERLEELWQEAECNPAEKGRTIFSCVQPLMTGTGDIDAALLELVSDSRRLALVVGDLKLSSFEDELSTQWPACLDGKERAFRVISAFWRVIQEAANSHRADLVLIDLGPNLGALNRAALISADHLAIPLSPDLFSLQGLRNLGPTVRRWRDEWGERRKKSPSPQKLELPAGDMDPAGYIVLQHAVRLDRPVKAYEKWIARIPTVYREYVLGDPDGDTPTINNDENCIALLKHYRSLMPMAQEARKPIFHLKPADGALGSHFIAVQEVEKHFRKLAENLLGRIWI